MPTIGLAHPWRCSPLTVQRGAERIDRVRHPVRAGPGRQRQDERLAVERSAVAGRRAFLRHGRGDGLAGLVVGCPVKDRRTVDCATPERLGAGETIAGGRLGRGRSGSRGRGIGRIVGVGGWRGNGAARFAIVGDGLGLAGGEQQCGEASHPARSRILSLLCQLPIKRAPVAKVASASGRRETGSRASFSGWWRSG